MADKPKEQAAPARPPKVKLTSKKGGSVTIPKEKKE